MTKAELVEHILNITEQYKKTQLMEKPKAELETIVDELTKAQAETMADDTALDALETQMLAFIPSLTDYRGTDSVMKARAFIQVAEDTFNLPLESCRKIFRGLRKKGYYTSKGKKEGQTRTTFQLTDLGIQYLTENNLLTAATTEAPAA